jgi:tetratricopeptide (TPR) repeat protein
MEAGLQQLRQAETAAPDDSDVQLERASGASSYGTMLATAGKLIQATAAFSTADDLFRKLVDDAALAPKTGLHYIKHLQNYAILHQELGQFHGAVSGFAHAVDVGNSLQRAASGTPWEPQCRVATAMASQNLAHAQILIAKAEEHDPEQRARKISDSMRHYDGALELLRSLVVDYPRIAEYRVRLAGTLAPNPSHQRRRLDCRRRIQSHQMADDPRRLPARSQCSLIVTPHPASRPRGRRSDASQNRITAASAPEPGI